MVWLGGRVAHISTTPYVLGENMKIEVHEISPNEKELIQNLLQFYEYEFSIYEEDDVDEKGFSRLQILMNTSILKNTRHY